MKLLKLFQGLMKESFGSNMKNDITCPLKLADEIPTNTGHKFFQLNSVIKNLTKTLIHRMNFRPGSQDREWFFATVSGPGSGKTYLCYHILLHALSGQLGGELEKLRDELVNEKPIDTVGDELVSEKPVDAVSFERLKQKLSKKIPGVQVNLSDWMRHQERAKIGDNRDTCLRMMFSYFFDGGGSEIWKKFYNQMRHLMPEKLERMIELIVMDWEERGYLEDKEDPFFFIFYDESYKIRQAEDKGFSKVNEYISKSNELILTFEKADNKSLRKVKIVNFFTALNPLQIGKQEDITSTRSDRAISWITLPDLRASLDDLVPPYLEDDSRDLFKLALYWTNGNPRLVEKMSVALLQILKNTTTLAPMNVTTALSSNEVERTIGTNEKWRFVALFLCRLAVPPRFAVCPQTVADLFLESAYTSSPPFPLVNLFKDTVVKECVTSKLFLFMFLKSLEKVEEKDKTLSTFINQILSLELALKHENWEPYLANIFALHLSCWKLIIQDDHFKKLERETLTVGNYSNEILSSVFRTGLLPLSQLFHKKDVTCYEDKEGQPKSTRETNEQEEVLGSKAKKKKRLPSYKSTACSEVLINLDVEWEVVKNFVPEQTILQPGKIYLPKSNTNPGWDFAICFHNGAGKLCIVYVQSKDLVDGGDGTLGPAIVGESICNTIDQTSVIKKKNRISFILATPFFSQNKRFFFFF